MSLWQRWQRVHDWLANVRRPGGRGKLANFFRRPPSPPKEAGMGVGRSHVHLPRLGNLSSQISPDILSKGWGPPHALGAILYKLLTGVRPFDGSDMEVMRHQVFDEPPISPRRLRIEIPAALEGICLTCMNKRPADRYHSAEALAEALRSFLQSIDR